MTSSDRLLEIAFAAVDEAKKIFLKPAEHQLTCKGDRDYATEADYEIERLVRKQLADATPDIGLLGEEEGHTGNTERWWCLDPIDGTVNYAHGSPLCGISLALMEDDEPVLGVIDLPLLGHRYSATVGGGAFRDGKPIHCSNTTELNEAVVAFGDFAIGENADERNIERRSVFDHVSRDALRVRMLGSAVVDLAWVAEGKIDLSVIVGGNIWDVAAGRAVASEAGAVLAQKSLGTETVAFVGTKGLVATVT